MVTKDLGTATRYFSNVKGQRETNDNHVKNIVRSIDDNGALLPVVRVNEKLEIIDGKHRFAALRELNMPIIIEIIPGWTIDEVKILNKTGLNWNAIDYFESGVSLGDPNCLRFKKYWDEISAEQESRHHTLLKFTSVLIILTNDSGREATEDLQNTEFVVTENDIKMAKERWCLISNFGRKFHPNGYHSKPFITAMLNVMKIPGFSIKKLEDSFKKKYSEILYIAHRMNVKEYISHFEKNYNGKVTDSSKNYFFMLEPLKNRSKD